MQCEQNLEYTYHIILVYKNFLIVYMILMSMLVPVVLINSHSAINNALAYNYIVCILWNNSMGSGVFDRCSFDTCLWAVVGFSQLMNTL